MKVKINEKLVGVDGKTPLPSKAEFGPYLTLKEICIRSILSPIETDKDMEKMTKYDLFKKFRDCKTNEIDLKAEEVVLLKKAIGKFQPPLILGQCYELLDK
jgi:hypothetical protein